jgi:hypothetical protein
MTIVNKTAETLDEGIKNMMAGAKNDYANWGKGSDYGQRQLVEWDSKTKVTQGKKYIKVVQENGVFAFIVKEDFKHFKKGDVLKAAGFNAPALNRARGNVLTGGYSIRWTGPEYLRG